MDSITKLLHDIRHFSSESTFEDLAYRCFEFQLKNVSIYRKFCHTIEVTQPSKLEEIPFLPISFFKTEKIIAKGFEAEKIFQSSGTGNLGRSKHYVAHLDLYEASFIRGFESFFGAASECVVMGLLPNYIEQGDSSLVYMVQKLIDLSKHPFSGFYLYNLQELLKQIAAAQEENKKIVLFGVSYALLDLAELRPNLNGITIIETGGMKGKRREILKEEMHQQLKENFSLKNIAAEYGMSELLSQAYALKDGKFSCTQGMRVLIRDTTDPFSYVENGKTGGINIIDLYNVLSCSFIATQDLGKKIENYFTIVGRYDQSEIRGCNLLVN
jgi:hypothetical protein